MTKTMPTHDADTTLCIYTDGSGINNHIGAAAYCPTIAMTKCQHLGKESTHNVYAAELSAIYFATTIVKENSQYTECVIYSAITTATKPDQQSGQSIICSILDNVESLQEQRSELTFSLTWIPCHKDMADNEEVDAEAKRAAQPRCNLGNPFTHPPMKSARNVVTQGRIKTQWTKEWQEGEEDSKQLRDLGSNGRF
jgi:ribonuclease HI